MNELEELRQSLNVIDNELVETLAERQSVIAQIASYKAATDIPLRDLSLEQDKLARLVEHAQRLGVDGHFVTRLFREIFGHSLRLQQGHITHGSAVHDSKRPRVVVAHLGNNGTYSHEATEQHFSGRMIELVPLGCPSFGAVLTAVERGDAQYGMLPVENTTAGSINEAYDLLAHTGLCAVGEEVLRIEHCLVGVEDVPLGSIACIYSHPQPLAQCSDFLATLPNCTVQSYPDTTAAVKKVRDDNDPTQVAIASERAAQAYGLRVLKRNLENQPNNFTRFLVVARDAVRYDARIPCKTSLIFSTAHEEGALLRCLDVLAKRGLNLTKLESRPRAHMPWEYLFYVDFEGNVAVPKVRDALSKLITHTSFFKVLGCYPSRTTSASRPAEPKRKSMAPSAEKVVGKKKPAKKKPAVKKKKR